MILYTPTPEHFYEDYIAHHGIKGQKWGVKNGPPYPLNSEGKASFKRNNLGKGDIQKRKVTGNKTNNSGYHFKDPFADDFLKEENDSNSESKKAYDKIQKANLLHEENYSKDKDRTQEAYQTGLAAIYEMGQKDEPTSGDPDWFLYEDQTIGYPAIADMVNRGFTKDKINSLIEDADKVDYEHHYDPGVFHLSEGGYGQSEFIDACFKVKARNNKIDKMVNETKLDNDGDNVSGIYKNRQNKDMEVFGFKEDGISDNDIKDVSKKLLKNEKVYEAICKEVMDDDHIYENWYLAMPWSKYTNNQLSKQEFYDNFSIQGAYVTKFGDNISVELSLLPKDGYGSNLIGGHEINIDIDYKRPWRKVATYASVNG